MLEEDAQMKLRLPVKLKEKVEEQAKKNKRTMNGEIVQILEDELLFEPEMYSIKSKTVSGQSRSDCLSLINTFQETYLSNRDRVINLQFEHNVDDTKPLFSLTMFYTSKSYGPRKKKEESTYDILKMF